MEERLARLETAHRTLRRWTGALVIALAVVLLVAAIPQDAQGGAVDRPPSSVPGTERETMDWEMYVAMTAEAVAHRSRRDGFFGFGPAGRSEGMLEAARARAKEAVDFYNR